MQYESYELLELFENEPKVIDKEAGMYDYYTAEINGFVLSLNIWEYDGNAYITLTHKDLKVPIYEVAINFVNKIMVKDNALFIFREGIEQPFTVYFKPNFSFSYRLDNPYYKFEN